MVEYTVMTPAAAPMAIIDGLERVRPSFRFSAKSFNVWYDVNRTAELALCFIIFERQSLAWTASKLTHGRDQASVQTRYRLGADHRSDGRQ
jgi:hypothetical protein